MYVYTHLTLHPLDISCQQVTHCCWADNVIWRTPPTLLSAQAPRPPGGGTQYPKPEVGPTHKGQEGRRPTFSSFQVPDADGARLGTSYDELLRSVEADTLHRGCVTCQALQREGGSSSELQG